MITNGWVFFLLGCACKAVGVFYYDVVAVSRVWSVRCRPRIADFDYRPTEFNVRNFIGVAFSRMHSCHSFTYFGSNDETRARGRMRVDGNKLNYFAFWVGYGVRLAALHQPQ